MQKILKYNEKILKNINNNEKYKEFVDYLKTLSKNETVEDIERHKKIINSNQQIIGISMQNIRAIAKIISKDSPQEFLNIAKSKKQEDSFYEETLIEGLVIAEIKDLAKQCNCLKIWAKKIDNWSTCDSVVVTLKKLKQSKDKNLYFNIFKNMCFDKKEFVARFGIVVLMVNYLDNSNIDEIFKIIKNIKHKGYYVKMAIAWLISFAMVINYEKTILLLKEKCFDKFIQNKSISKCRESFRISNKIKNEIKLLKM